MECKLDSEHFVQLLTKQQQNILQNYLKVLKSASAAVTPAVQEELVQFLSDQPYPALQILQQEYLEQSKFYVDRTISLALERLLLSVEEADAISLKLINYLANFPQCILESTTLNAKVLHVCQRAWTVNNAIYLALLSRTDKMLLAQVLAALEQKWLEFVALPDKAFVLHQALTHKLHFVPLLSGQIKNFSQINDVAVRNNLLIVRLLKQFFDLTKTLAEVGNISKWLEAFDVSQTTTDLQEVHQFFYADFQRINCILSFLQKHSETYNNMKIGELLQTQSVLELLLRQNINVSYEDAHRLIESTYKWQRHLPATKWLRSSELHTLTYYGALVVVYDTIMADSSLSNEHYYNGKMQQLQMMLRQMRNLDMLCTLIEDIFQLVLLRWEHLQLAERKRAAELQRQNSRSTRSSDSDESSMEDAATETAYIRPALLPAARNGFVCCGRALKSIFTLLKNFVTRKVHSEDYKQASERVQLRFQRCVDIINETLWKYSVLEKIDDSLSRSDAEKRPCRDHLEAELLLHMVQLHVDPAERVSSDDEPFDHSNYTSLTRRKVAKKRRRATFSGALGSARAAAAAAAARERNNLMSVSTVENVCDSVAQRRAREMIVRLTDGSIVPKMLSSPQNLAIMALSLTNLDDVKYIIETFNLQNSALNRELLFVEQQQQVKQKLLNIYANYQQQHEQTISAVSVAGRATVAANAKPTVEHIKQVAAKGFEVSKIISVVDNFAQTQRVHQTPELRQLVQRYSNHTQYSALVRQFEERNLYALLICDLIFGLPFNREITSHILMVIRRQQQISTGIVASSKDDGSVNVQECSRLPRDMGAMSLLENLCECLRLLDDRQSLLELLSDNYYSLKPRELTVELQRERTFHALYHKPESELMSCAQLKASASLVQQLQPQCEYYARFCVYVVQLTQLLQLRDRNLEYHTTQLLRTDASSIIGELIFDCDMTPLEIEAHVAALNLNLVHVIALNMCPELATDQHSDNTVAPRSRLNVNDPKQQTILNYIANQHRLLAYLLQCVLRSPQLHMEPGMHLEQLQQYLCLPEMADLCPLYEGNRIIAALRADQISFERVKRLPSKLNQLRLLEMHMGNRGSQQISIKNVDCLLHEVILENTRHISLAGHIEDIALRARLIQDHFTKISSTRLAKELIDNTLQHRNALVRIPQELRKQLEHTLADITVYAEVSEVLQLETWPQAYDFGLKTPHTIFQRLLYLQMYELCYKWCEVVKLNENFGGLKRTLLDTLLEVLVQQTDEVPEDYMEKGENIPGSSSGKFNSYLQLLLESFSVADCVSFLDAHKEKFRSLALLQYTFEFLEKNAPDGTMAYKNYKVSLTIIEQLSPDERAQCWHLLRYPLLIVEQLIMNSKFELLTKVLAAVRRVLQRNGSTRGSGSGSDDELCAYCFDKRGHLYDIRTKGGAATGKSRLQFGSESSRSASSAFILLNFNLYQPQHYITNECIDLLLRIYATKALDYHIADAQTWERASQSTDMQQSLDSLCGAFEMPRSVPTRDDWVRDEEATHCMCCRRVAFTMLMRRHHCRRCGRVVCFACSTHRMRIPESYADVEVRICNDCHRFTEEAAMQIAMMTSQSKTARHDCAVVGCGEGVKSTRLNGWQLKWKLSGNITHDKMLREEFCYEHAPSVALCLSILDYHLEQQKCIDLLLYHCRQLEKLIVPNPEVDYELVAKMMSCLALAAKVRGGSAEVETICEHSEIVLSVVQYGCEALIPPGPLNNYSLRKLADSLVQAEKWQLALEVHLKCGFPTAGVMAAHGLSCIRAGCYDMAREKFSHCMTKLSNETANARILKCLNNPQLHDIDNQNADMPQIKRPKRGTPLLQEIVKLIETTPYVKPQQETLQRASIIRNSNTSLVALLSHRKDTCVTPIQEPALNILNTLANLKRIAKGQYSDTAGTECNTSGSAFRLTRSFDECMYYLLTYGSHTNILKFLMTHDDLKAALKYVLIQDLDSELFVQHVYLPCLRCGRIPALLEMLHSFDDRLIVWQQLLFQTCRYLETEKLLNCLYQLQILLKDPVRASMTCVKFYSMNCENFQQLHANAEHLHNAHRHLQSELEVAQWENIPVESQASTKRRPSLSNRRLSSGSVGGVSLKDSFVMQMDARALNSHINTILRQLDVAKFLANCEKEYSHNGGELNTEAVLKQIRLEAGKNALPTLFDTQQHRLQICVLLLLCGKNIEEGFGLAYRIIEAYKLPAMKVFATTAKYLAGNRRLPEVEKLLDCITSNNGKNARELDDLLSVAINSAINCHEPEAKITLDNLTKRIHSVELRISCHIYIGQLKSAYLLANKHERLNDIRRIMREAELTNQLHIKKLCEKKLNMNTSQTEDM